MSGRERKREQDRQRWAERGRENMSGRERKREQETQRVAQRLREAEGEVGFLGLF